MLGLLSKLLRLGRGRKNILSPPDVSHMVVIKMLNFRSSLVFRHEHTSSKCPVAHTNINDQWPHGASQLLAGQDCVGLYFTLIVLLRAHEEECSRHACNLLNTFASHILISSKVSDHAAFSPRLFLDQVLSSWADVTCIVHDRNVNKMSAVASCSTEIETEMMFLFERKGSENWKVGNPRDLRCSR